jgi:predicted HTH transcriptional regulator
MDTSFSIPDFDLGFELSNLKISDLINLISRGESTFLEFKRKVSSPEKIAREMCAFANSQGGILLIGVDDDGTITGVNNHYEEGYLLEIAANKLCKPAISYKVDIIAYQHTEVMLIRVAQSENKPVYVHHKNKRIAFVRENDESTAASDQVIGILRNETSTETLTFEFGDNERALFQYLREEGRVTVESYARLIHETSYRASKILVNLVSAGILSLYTQNQIEYFTFAPENS